MCNRRPKGPRLCFFNIHMNPLVVARGLGKQIDLLLRDGEPVTHGDFSACQSGEIGEGLEYFHALTLAKLQRMACQLSDKATLPKKFMKNKPLEPCLHA